MQSVMLVVPGRKTDTSDAQWLCQLLECGLLRASFVPPKPIRELRDLTRYRKALIRERAARPTGCTKRSRTPGSSSRRVATDVLGVSGRLVLNALICGTRDPEVLAELAKGTLRKKIPELERALAGEFKPHHTLIVSHILAHLDYLDEAIATLSVEVERRLTPFAYQAELLSTITGVAERNSQVILAELGPDMSRFPSDRHAASWVAICPGNDESAGKRRSGKTRKGNPLPALLAGRGCPRRARSKNTPTCVPNTNRSSAAAVTRRRSSPSPTDPDRRLPHILPRDEVPYQRPRWRLLHPTSRPRTNRQTPCRATTTTRAHGHAAGSGGSLNVSSCQIEPTNTTRLDSVRVRAH